MKATWSGIVLVVVVALVIRAVHKYYHKQTYVHKSRRIEKVTATSVAVAVPRLIVQESFEMPGTLVIGGCARNIEGYLHDSFQKMYALIYALRANHDYRIVVYHNDSSDMTLQVLKHFESLDPTHVILLDATDSEPSRVKRLATGRNAILSTIHQQIPNAIYFFNVDLDDKFPHLVTQPQQLACIQQCISKYNALWDVLSFNKAPNYYDIWALRTERDPFNCFGPHFKSSRAIDRQVYGCQTWYHTRFLQPYSDSQLLHPVHSAFAGFAIYKLNKTIGCKYQGYDDEGIEDCEHVYFHHMMRHLHQAKCRVYPIVIYGTLTDMTTTSHSDSLIDVTDVAPVPFIDTEPHKYVLQIRQPMTSFSSPLDWAYNAFLEFKHRLSPYAVYVIDLYIPGVVTVIRFDAHSCSHMWSSNYCDRQQLVRACATELNEFIQKWKARKSDKENTAIMRLHSQPQPPVVQQPQQPRDVIIID